METHQTILFEIGGSIPTSPLQLHVKEILKLTAANFYKRWHYLGDGGFIHQFSFGAYFDGCLLGAITFGPPLAKEIKGLYSNSSDEFALELTRLAMHDDCPKNSESRFISVAIRLLKKLFPVRIIISYADPSVGHDGCIYRASGFDYKGLTAQKTDYYVDGKRYKGSSTWKWAKEQNGEWLPRPRKHLYVKEFAT